MILVGVDEVGRGCWAGPLVAGAVAWPTNRIRKGIPVKLRDSKKLSKRQRELTAAYIQQHALAIGLGWVSASELDSVGVTQAVRLAMERAVNGISLVFSDLIIDGNINYLSGDTRARAVINADDSIPAVSAASIVAKVARDTYMCELSEKYAGYGFERHVGYGTAMHLDALRLLGVSDIHRKSYKPITKFLETIT